VRRGSFALSAEMTVLVADYDSGYVTSGFLGIGLTSY